MKNGDEIARLSGTELVSLYQARKLSPVEATHAILDRIGRLDHHVNAFAHLDPDAALSSARASEARWQKGTTMSSGAEF